MTHMKTEDSQIIEKSSFLKEFDEDSFQSLCKSCEILWKVKQCGSRNPAHRICVDPECTEKIFICNTQKCKQCPQKHEKCYTTQVSGLEKLLNQIIAYQQTFFKKLYDIDEQLISKIKSSQKALAKTISSGSLGQKFVKTLAIIHGEEQAQNFTGKDSKQLFEQLRRKVKQKNQKQNQLEELFAKRSDTMINDNIELKAKIFQNFLKRSVPTVPEIPKPKYFINSALITFCINQLYMNTPEFYKNKTYDTFGYLQFPNPEKLAFEKRYMDFLTTQLGNPKNANLLFRASQHNFQAAQFHKRCDGKANTLTIIRTQFKKTIFAFAAQPWASAGSYVNDPTGKSCIIWLDTLQKLSMTNAAHSIHGNASYGPTFGSGHDIYIANSASGSTGFPSTYNNNKGGQSQQTYTMMTGNPNGSSFNILQYEVYELTF